MPKAHPSRRSIEERDALIIQWQYLPQYVVKKMLQSESVRRLGFEDARAAGYVGLIKAAQLWDSTRGVQFQSYAHRCIWSSILRTCSRNFLILNKAKKGESPIVEQIPPLYDPPGDWDDPDFDQYQKLTDAIRTLSEREQKLVDLYYFKGFTLKAAGAEVMITRERVRQILYQVKKKLRDCLKA